MTSTCYLRKASVSLESLVAPLQQYFASAAKVQCTLLPYEVTLLGTRWTQTDPVTVHRNPLRSPLEERTSFTVTLLRCQAGSLSRLS